MSDSDTYDHSDFVPGSGSSPSNAELQQPGKAGRSAFLGFKTLPKEEPAETYGNSDDELRRAARDHAAERGSTDRSHSDDHVPEVPDDGGKYALSVNEAAKQLAAKRRAAELDEARANLTNLGRETDNARFLADAVNRGEITIEGARQIEAIANQEAQQQSQQPEQPPVEAEQPQPESVEQPAPAGLSPKVAAALQDPEIRQAIEAVVHPAQQAREIYTNATSELAASCPRSSIGLRSSVRQQNQSRKATSSFWPTTGCNTDGTI
jgi:hypothetical protein